MIPDLQDTEGFEPLRELDFDFDKASAIPPSASPSHFIDGKPAGVDHTARLTSDRASLTPLHAPLPFRPHRPLARSERSAPVISGSELLHLEGRPVRHGRTATVPISEPVLPTIHTLKRKDKFYGSPASIPRSSAQCFSRTPSDELIPSVSEIPLGRRPSSTFESVQQRIEQTRLQTAMAQPSTPTYMFQDLQRQPPTRWTQDDVSSRTVYSHRKAWSEVPGLGGDNAPLMAYYQEQSQSTGHDGEAHTSLSSHESSHQYESGLQQQATFHGSSPRHLRSNQAWGDMMGFTQDFHITPGQINPEWLHDLNANNDSFYQNSMSYPTPNHHSHSTMLGQGGLSDGCHSVAETNAPAQSLHFDSFQEQAEVGSLQIPQPPHTPPPSNPSASPSSPADPLSPKMGADPPPTSPPKQARINRKKQGSLRLPKSTATLRSAKSSSNLKCTKSTGNLKSRKSIGQVGVTSGNSIASGSEGHGMSRSPIKKEFTSHRVQHQPPQQLQMQPQSMFMNFTPNDKDKILTGVAPSGSSKTKARREQEEREQKRRMSLAARREIERLGGAMPAELMGIDLA